MLNRQDGSLHHYRFFEIVHFLRAGDVMVFNESRVIPARLRGKKSGGGGKIEILLLKQIASGIWEALAKPGKRVSTGVIVDITDVEGKIRTSAEVMGVGEDGLRVIKFADDKLLPEIGEIPLPPYIHTPLTCPERYQTVYARTDGSVAAPTAGLHFTSGLMNALRQQGVICLPVTLHVGLDTFQPVKADDPQQHTIHKEYGVMSETTAHQISLAKAEGRRVICVGTTAVRLVEHVAQKGMPLKGFAGWVDLFILPGFQFRIADAMITNFHLPRTTLLMLVSAFASKELIDHTYSEAIKERYRFYSFGDAMLIF